MHILRSLKPFSVIQKNQSIIVLRIMMKTSYLLKDTQTLIELVIKKAKSQYLILSSYLTENLSAGAQRDHQK